MNIGIFDSGLGGLLITHAVVEKLPNYNYIYLGDTANLPYGNKTTDQIYQFTKDGLEYLFQKNCKLVIVACNSASAEALRRIQQEFIPQKWPDRKALGVLIPSAEVAVTNGQNIGVICTTATADSKAFDREIGKLSDANVIHQPTPELVENIEDGNIEKAHDNLQRYLSELTAKNIDTLILGCTHYPILKNEIAQIVGPSVNIVSQDEVIPAKLMDYLSRHSEISDDLAKNMTREFYVTKITPANMELSSRLFGHNVELQLAELQ